MFKHYSRLGFLCNFFCSVKFLVFTPLFISILFCGCASTQDLVLTNKRIHDQAERSESLKSTVEGLRKKDSNLENELQGLFTRIADMDTQIKFVQEQIMTLEAKLEDYRQLLDRSISDTLSGNEKIRMDLERMDSAVKKISKQINEVQDAQQTIKSSQPAFNMEDLNEESFYNLAYDTFKQGQFDKAREQFSSFLERFPKGKFSDNARFWIGECHYRKNEYEEAILEYERVKNEYPSGDKVPSALFKQALSFLKLNQKEEARIIFEDLILHYPQSEQAGMAREQLEKIK
ncbi:MAG: tol-pal system protein YbgF [bacterium]